MEIYLKKIIVLLLSVIFTLSTFVGCTNESTEKQTDAIVWTMSNNEKILRDEVELYKEFHGNTEINVFAGKNEKESWQFTITTFNRKVSEYTVEVNDLNSENGNTFSKSNIELFNQKYYLVGSANDYYTKTGLYPDALLPFDAAVKYGENNVEAGKNQSVLVRFDVPENQEAGLYQGSIKVTVDGSDFYLPVKLTVYDTTISEEVHSRSSFSVTYAMEKGEFDYSMDKKMDYLEFLAEYFVSGSDIFNMNTPIENYTEDGIRLWINYYKELYNNPKVSTLKFPILRAKLQEYTMRDGTHVKEADKTKKIVVTDKGRSQPVLNALLKACVEDNKNYISKLYFRGLDEPNLVGSVSSLEVISDSYLEIVEEGEKYISRLKNSENDLFIEEIIETLKNVPIITTYFDIQTFSQPINYCPSFDWCTTEANINKYIQASHNNEMWWYGCNNPAAPLPTYHVDDSLIAAKVLSWMQYDYGVTGNLYWAVDNWHSNGQRWDFYDANTIPEKEMGEGLLLYPGEPYGLDTPVASVRLEAIRDGLEEYEILYAIDQKYKAIDTNYSVDNIYNYLAQTMYSGVEIVRDIKTYETSRKALYELSQLSSVANFGITNVEIVDGTYKVELFADSACEIKSNGTVLTAQSDNGSVKKYVDYITLGNNVNGFNYSATINGKTYGFEWKLGSNSDKYSAEQLENMPKKSSYIETDMELFNEIKLGTEIGLTDTAKYLQLGIAGNTSGDEQRFNLENDVIKSINEDVSKVVLEIYYMPANPSEKRYINIGAKYEKRTYLGGVVIPLTTRYLEAGMNIIEINTATTPWQQSGALQFFEISYSQNNATYRESVEDVYLKSITIMYK